MKRSYSVIAAVLVLLVWSAVAFADPASQENEPKAWSSNTDGMADVAEVEPNNSLALAQFLGCGNVLRPASIAAGVAPPDTDYVSFTAIAGSFITIGTDADGAGGVGDTRIRLFNDSGVTLATDDDGGPVFYSLISNFVAPYTGTYYVGIAAFSTQTGTYKAFINCITCPPGVPEDVCAGAIPLACGNIDYSGNTICYTNNYTPLASGTGGCTGFTAQGRDLVYRINAAAGDVLNVTYTNSADGSIYLITDCANPTTTCVAGADATLSGQAEVLNYAFPAAGVYYLIVDSFGTNTSGSYTLVGSLDCITPTEKVSWGKVKAIYR